MSIHVTSLTLVKAYQCCGTSGIDLQVTDILGDPTEANRAEKEERYSKESGKSQASVTTILVGKAIVSLQANVI